MYGLMRLQDKIMTEHPTRYLFGKGNVTEADVLEAAVASTQEAVDARVA